MNEAFSSAMLPANSSSELLSMVQLGSKGKGPKMDPHVTITLLALPELQSIWCSTYSSTPWNVVKILTHNTKNTHIFVEFLWNSKLITQLPPAVIESISLLPVESLQAFDQERLFAYQKEFVFHRELLSCNSCVNLAATDGVPRININNGQVLEYVKAEKILYNIDDLHNKDTIIDSIKNIKSVLNNKNYNLTSDEKAKILIDISKKSIMKDLDAEMKYISKKK